MSGSPHGVFGGVQAFGAAFVCPATMSGASATIAATPKMMKRGEVFICGFLVVIGGQTSKSVSPQRHRDTKVWRLDFECSFFPSRRQTFVSLCLCGDT